MSLQFTRGTGVKNDTYTGPSGSISIDFTGKNIRVHDGTTPGGDFKVGQSSDSVGTDLGNTTTDTSVTITSSTGDNTTVPSASSSKAGVLTSAGYQKLQGIEANATSDQSASEIKTAYESNSNTNAYTDGDKSKLSSIAEGAEKNRNIASKQQASQGSDNTTVITPLRLFEALAAGSFSIDFGEL